MTRAIMAPASAGVNMAEVNQRLPLPFFPVQPINQDAREHVAAKPRRADPRASAVELHDVQKGSNPSEASGSSLQEQVVTAHRCDPEIQPLQPRYVRACQSKAWTVRLWPKKDPQNAQNVCYACRSWRCPGDCARANAAQLFARLTTSIARIPDYWSFVTLTLNPRRFKTRSAMYQEASRAWTRFRHALKHRFGYDEFLIVFEISVRAKALHIHGIVRSKRLASVLALQPGERPQFSTCPKTGKPKRLPTAGERGIWKTWLKPTAIKCGFGFKCDISAVNDQAAMNGYLVKSSNISGELSQTNSKDQLPIDAPKGFRRVRASRGFLVPKTKNEEVTGRLIQRPVEFVDRNDGPRMVYLSELERAAPRSLLAYLERVEKISPAVAGVEYRIAFLEKHRRKEDENARSKSAGSTGETCSARKTVQASTIQNLPVTDGRATLGIRERDSKEVDTRRSVHASLLESLPEFSSLHPSRPGRFDFGYTGDE